MLLIDLLILLWALWRYWVGYMGGKIALGKKLKKKSPFYSLIMVDECTDITTIKELLIFCRLVELRWRAIGTFFGPLMRADAASIHSIVIQF